MRAWYNHGVKFFGVIWVCEATVTAHDEAKRDWGKTIKRILLECPKKHRRKWAQVICQEMKTAKALKKSGDLKPRD